LIDNVHKLLLQFSIKMITVKAGQKPIKEQIKRIQAAAKTPDINLWAKNIQANRKKEKLIDRRIYFETQK